MAGSIVTCPNCGKANRIRSGEAGIPRCAVCHHRLPWIVAADKVGFDAELSGSVPVLVDFWAPWCGPCKWVEPVVEEVAKEKAGELKVVKVNIDEAPDIAARYGVRGIPLLLIARDGDEVDRLVGAASKQQLQTWLGRHLGAPAGAGP